MPRVWSVRAWGLCTGPGLSRLPILRAGCGRGCAGAGAQQLFPWPACPVGAASRGGGGGPSPGGWPATVVTDVRCQALSLPRSPALWGGQPGFGDLYVPGAVGAGVETWHQPHSARPCELALRAVWVAEGHPRVGCLYHCDGGLRPGAPPLPASSHPSPTCCGCGCAGVGAQHRPLGLHALWELRAAGLVAGLRRGAWSATIVRGVRCQALSLPRPPFLWGGQPGFSDPCVPRAVGAGVGTRHRPVRVCPCGPALLAVGVAEGRPGEGCLLPL